MQKLEVYSHETQQLIGHGYVILYPNGTHSAPELFDLMGVKLPEGWYVIKVTGENRNVVVPKGIQ